jgi:hypothetical protein
MIILGTRPSKASHPLPHVPLSHGRPVDLPSELLQHRVKGLMHVVAPLIAQVRAERSNLSTSIRARSLSRNVDISQTAVPQP